MHDLGEFDTIVYSHAVDALGNYQFQPAAPPNPRRQRFELVAHIIECAPMYWRYSFLCDTVGFRLAEVVLAVLPKNLSLRTVSVRRVSHMPSPRPPLRNSLLRRRRGVEAFGAKVSVEHRPVARAPTCRSILSAKWWTGRDSPWPRISCTASAASGCRLQAVISPGGLHKALLEVDLEPSGFLTLV